MCNSHNNLPVSQSVSVLETQPLIHAQARIYMHICKHTVLRLGDYLAKLGSSHAAGVSMQTCCLRFRLGPLEGFALSDTCGWMTTP